MHGQQILVLCAVHTLQTNNNISTNISTSDNSTELSTGYICLTLSLIIDLAAILLESMEKPVG